MPLMLHRYANPQLHAFTPETGPPKASPRRPPNQQSIRKTYAAERKILFLKRLHPPSHTGFYPPSQGHTPTNRYTGSFPGRHLIPHPMLGR